MSLSKEDWKMGYSEGRKPGCGLGCMLVALVAAFGWAALLISVSLIIEWCVK